MPIVRVDGKGRVVIPKDIREKVELREGSYVRITTKEKCLIIEPMEPSADKYFGAFKITNWPKDLDEFAVEAIRKWWTSQAT